MRWLAKCAYPPHGGHGEGISLLVYIGKGAYGLDVEEFHDGELDLGRERVPWGCECRGHVDATGETRSVYEEAGQMKVRKMSRRRLG